MSSYLTRKHINRRTFLRGMGAAFSLPLLDAMVPAAAHASQLQTVAPRRLGFVYVPNGIIMEHWTPASEGADFALPHILEPLANVRSEVTVASGLAQLNARALGDGGGDHARASAVFLTGVHPYKTGGADLRAGVSVDQLAAQHLGTQTRFPSLELTVEPGKLTGDCDTGYSCAYSNSISWRTATTPNPPEGNPRQVFERLFGASQSDLSPEERAKRRAYRGSLLDFVLADAHQLQSRLGPSDRRKMDEYLYAVRTIERQIEFNENVHAGGAPELEVPESAPEDYAEYARLMYDLQALAFQTDQTRVITFMMGREGSSRAYREVGAKGGHHELSHHLGDGEKITQLRDINRYHIEQFARFLEKLRSIEDGDGTLLDHSLLVYGSGISDGNSHNHADLPVLVAGRAGGAVAPGRHLRYAQDTPMANLYLSVLAFAGCPTDALGDSSGPLDHLGGLDA